MRITYHFFPHANFSRINKANIPAESWRAGAARGNRRRSAPDADDCDTRILHLQISSPFLNHYDSIQSAVSTRFPFARAFWWYSRDLQRHHRSQGKHENVMAPKRRANAVGTDGLAKASSPSVKFHKSKNSWYITCWYYPSKGSNGTLKSAWGYATEALANADAELYRFAVHHDGAANWQKEGGRELYTEEMKNNNLLPKKSRADVVLNGAEKQQLKKLRRVDPDLSRSMFAAFNGQEDLDRHMRRAVREGQRETKGPLIRDSRVYYLTEQRLPTLYTIISKTEEQMAYLATKLANSAVAELVIREGEVAPRKDTEEDDFSAAQLQRVTMQAMVLVAALGKRTLKLIAERDIILRLKEESTKVDMEGEPVPLNVDAFNKELEDLTVKSSVLNIMNETFEAFKLSTPGITSARTYLIWWQQFHQLGGKGFLEDGRGKHDRGDNWIEQWGLVEKLTLFLLTTKVITVSIVHEWIQRQPALLLDKDPEGYEGLKSTVGRSSVHRYMLNAGAKYDTVKQNYYTDSHEENRPDREDRYIPEKMMFARRQPEWFSMEVKKVPDAAMEFTRLTYNLMENDPLPVWRAGVLTFALPDEIQDKDLLKVHLGFLSDENDMYVRTREAIFQKTGVSGEYLFNLKADGEEFDVPDRLKPLFVCQRRHLPGVCRCNRRLMAWGQDESCYCAYALPAKAWKMKQQVVMRKKTEGQGIMVTVFLCADGVSFELTSDQLAAVNANRACAGRRPLTESPGFLFFEYGMRREGYWNSDRFCEQVIDVIDCLEVIHPGVQFVFEVDQSSGHTKHKSDGLSANVMGMKWGGKQALIHATKIVDNTCLGEETGRILNIGDVQHMTFQPGDSPPWYDPSATPQDRDENSMTAQEIESRQKVVAKDREKWKEGDAPVDDRIYVAGYVGKAKGLKQVLWERGLWKDKMVMSKSEKEVRKLLLNNKPVPDPSMYADHAILRCTDFKEEKNHLAELIESRGHILLLGVKCHPEMAGLGIEYVFGYSKRTFRKNNDCVTKNLEANVKRSFSPDVMTKGKLWKFWRRTWMYQQMYRELKGGTELLSYDTLEKTMRQKKKTHRNILEIENKFLKEIESSL